MYTQYHWMFRCVGYTDTYINTIFVLVTQKIYLSAIVGVICVSSLRVSGVICFSDYGFPYLPLN